MRILFKIYLKLCNISETFFKFLETMFIKISEQDLIRKIIKDGVMFYLTRL